MIGFERVLLKGNDIKLKHTNRPSPALRCPCTRWSTKERENKQQTASKIT